MATFPIFQKGYIPPEKKIKSGDNEAANRLKYESINRQRTFQTSWLNEFDWLVYKEGQMTCNICSLYDDVGSFVTGSTVFRKNCLQSHEKSDSHLKFIQIQKARSNPSATVAMKTSSMLQNPYESTGRTEKGNKAIHFYKASRSKDVWLMLHLLLDILSILSSVSKRFQDRRADIQSILTEIDMAVRSLEKLETRDGFYMRKAGAEPPSDLTGNDRVFVSARKRLLSTILDALHRRFTDNPGILAACSILNLSVFPTKSDAVAITVTVKIFPDYGEKEVDTLVDFFEPALTAAGVDVGVIASEWLKLKTHMLLRYQNPQETNWEDVNSKLGQVCPNILQLVDLVLTIPTSSADAERGFSQLKNIKTDRRTRLQDVTLCDQMTVLLETEDINEFDPMPAISLWMKPERRVQQAKLPVESKIVLDENLNEIVPDVEEPIQCPNLDNELVETLITVNTESDSKSDREPVEPSTETTGSEDFLDQANDKSVQVDCHECINSQSFPFIAIKLIDTSVQTEFSPVADYCTDNEYDETYERDEDYDFENFDIVDGVREIKKKYIDRVECAGKAFLEFREVCSTSDLKIGGE
ncbi:uncharacterized protein LOC123560712 [Mercenaria mercenaria]|uniref:uncharacterized protein LOC123560712 n=1 Tax=Mercenaria mercenaria TaxID=6596 RepID=UPI00234E894C|nr:uncharacterized protein LOC123560712 [Mercenaria mercenaria]